MNEKKKHKIMLGIEVILLCMIVAILGTNAASSNPPSNGVSYNKNSQTTVEGALNDLYTKANYGNATASQILKDKTALVGGKKVTGTMEDRGLAQYGSWGCGDLGCGSGDDAYYSINSLPEGYYHSDGNWWAPEARINANTLRASLGITADKIVKGQSIAGVSGTGETGYSSCSSCCPTLASQTSSATAGAGDILSGKTAYVNGSKITGSMANKGAVSATVAPGGTYTIPAGYHNGSGKVTASSCPTCATGINDDNSTRKTGKMTNGIEASIGDYYMISYNIGTLKVSSVTFDGCNVIVQDIASTSISGTTYRTTTVICKATSSKITVSNVPNNWTWYKLN
jgi:hypothetical protein